MCLLVSSTHLFLTNSWSTSSEYVSRNVNQKAGIPECKKKIDQKLVKKIEIPLTKMFLFGEILGWSLFLNIAFSVRREIFSTSGLVSRYSCMLRLLMIIQENAFSNYCFFPIFWSYQFTAHQKNCLIKFQFVQ